MDRMELTNKHVDLAMGMSAVETAVKQSMEIAGMVIDCIENWDQYCGLVRGKDIHQGVFESVGLGIRPSGSRVNTAWSWLTLMRGK